MDDFSKIKQSIADLEGETLLKLVKNSLEKMVDPYKILHSLREGIEEIGRRYEMSEYFISELVYAGELMKSAMEVLKPHMKIKGSASPMASVVLGSALGDIHDIGKEIVRTLLISAGFEVYDLGVDVTPKAFVEKAKESGAEIIGVSALLSTTTKIASEIIELLKDAGLKDEVKVILGGAAVRGWMVEKFGVDAAVNDAIEGIKVIKSWVDGS